MVKQDLSVFESMQSSPLARVLLIGFLILLLQIPVLLIFGLVQERENTSRQAVQEVTSKWGRSQTLQGPVLVVPYIHRWVEENKEGEERERAGVRKARFLPETLELQGRVEAEQRSRGIFRVPVYRAALEASGDFRRPDFSDWGVHEKDILWDRAQLVVRISDLRAIQNQAFLTWQSRTVPFNPGAGELGGAQPAMHASLKDLFEGLDFEYAFNIELNGSQGIFLTPFGKETRVQLASNWEHPSFQGNWLPEEREVGGEGFEATWHIPSLGRNYPQRWRGEEVEEAVLQASSFGVELMTPVDPYRMTQRSLKYEILFLFLPFLAMWLFEVLARVRIHWIEYLLVGAGMVIFYLLELSLSEHLGFPPAYLFASLAVFLLITAYCAAVLKGMARASVIGAVVAGLYVYLFVLLNNEDYALLIGSVGLFVILSAVMFLTRRIDWHSHGGSAKG